MPIQANRGNERDKSDPDGTCAILRVVRSEEPCDQPAAVDPGRASSGHGVSVRRALLGLSTVPPNDDNYCLPTLSHIHLSLGLYADDASAHGRLSHIHTLASLTVHRRRECTRQQQNQLPKRQLSLHRVACNMSTTLWARVKSPRRAQLCRFVLIYSRARVYICMLFFACV